jgi:hypothetical protein
MHGSTGTCCQDMAVRPAILRATDCLVNRQGDCKVQDGGKGPHKGTQSLLKPSRQQPGCWFAGAAGAVLRHKMLHKCRVSMAICGCAMLCCAEAA